MISRIFSRAPPLISPLGRYRRNRYSQWKQIQRFCTQTVKISTEKKEEEPEVKKEEKTDWTRLWSFTRREWKLLGQGLGCLTISSGVQMSLPIAFGTIVDIATGLNTWLTLDQVVPSLAGVFLLGGAANAYRIYCFQTAGNRVVRSIRKDLYKSISSQEIAYFDATKTGDLVTRLTSDTTLMGTSLAGNSVAALLRTFTQITGSFCLMLYLSPPLFGVMVGVIPIAAVGTKMYGKFVKETQTAVQTGLSDATHVAEENLANIRTVRFFGAEAQTQSAFNSKVDNVYELQMKQIRGSAVFWGAGSTVVNCFMLAVLGYGGHLVQMGLITAGTLTSFLMYSLSLSMASFGLASTFAEVMRGVGASTRLFEIIDRESAVPNIGGRSLPQIEGKIEFENITFRYPSRLEDVILENFNLKIEPGKSLALVGPSGSGKSTCMNLLLRLYDAEKGKVSLDGNDISELDPTWIRRSMGIVPQEPALFSGTLLENICFGLDSWDENDPELMERVIQATHDSNCYDFINEFPDGFQTAIGERGVNLSGGQKQRIAICRALLKNPRVLLLDEATSALDAQSERLVSDAISRAIKSRTVIVIAHRLSTIRNCDNIGVIEDGQVVEYGTHDSLVREQNSRYRSLMAAQMYQRY